MTAFTVEDGSGLEDSTSYVDVAFSDDYLGSSWAADTAAKQSALISASEYFDARWGKRLMGRPVNSVQGLEFPRLSVYDRYGWVLEGVPVDLKKSVCLYAKESVAGTLYPTPPSASSKDIKKKKTVVGPITTEVEYQGANTAASWLPFPLADNLAKQFVYSSFGGVIRN